MGRWNFLHALPDDIRNDIILRSTTSLMYRNRILGPYMEQPNTPTKMTTEYIAQQLALSGFAIMWGGSKGTKGLEAWTAVTEGGVNHLIRWPIRYIQDLRSVPKTYEPSITMQGVASSNGSIVEQLGHYWGLYVPKKLARQACFILLDIQRLLLSHVLISKRLLTGDTDGMLFLKRVDQYQDLSYRIVFGEHDIELNYSYPAVYIQKPHRHFKPTDTASLEELRHQPFYATYMTQQPWLEKHHTLVVDLIAKMDIAKYDV